MRMVLFSMRFAKENILSGRQWLSVERFFHTRIAHDQAISDAQQSVKGMKYLLYLVVEAEYTHLYQEP
jgi:hypothetical protein